MVVPRQRDRQHRELRTIRPSVFDIEGIPGQWRYRHHRGFGGVQPTEADDRRRPRVSRQRGVDRRLDGSRRPDGIRLGSVRIEHPAIGRAAHASDRLRDNPDQCDDMQQRRVSSQQRNLHHPSQCTLDRNSDGCRRGWRRWLDGRQGNDHRQATGRRSGTSLLVTNGGTGGTAAGAGGAGGTAGSGCDTNLPGGSGGGGGWATSAVTNGPGGHGGSSSLGGGGGSTSSGTAGTAGATNTGGGGGGGSQGSTATGVAGGGGGSGGSRFARINTPGATFSYAVGATATGGTAGATGGAGGPGALA